MQDPTLFDPVDRTDGRPGLYGEQTFDFLNRVAGPYWDDVRWTLEHWLSHVPPGPDHADLRARLRAADHEHRAALVELFVHELLVRAGYDVEIHPALPHTSRRPDFLAAKGREAVYIEVATWGSRPEARARTARENDLLRAIEQCNSPNFFLRIGNIVQGTVPARGRRARTAIERWLASMDPDDPALLEAGSLQDLAGMTWRDGDWIVEVQAIPVAPEYRGRPDHRPIAMRGDMSAQFIDDAPELRRILDHKAKSYGSLSAPFVIALGSWTWDPDQWHFMNCLYGALQYSIKHFTDGTTTTAPTRDPHGFFISPQGWRNQHVSGVLHINQLSEGMLLNPNLDLWLHPDPEFALGSADLGLPVRVCVPVDGDIQTLMPAASLASHLHLPEKWPRGEPWPRT